MPEDEPANGSALEKATIIISIVLLAAFGIVSAVFKLSADWVWPAIIVIGAIGAAIEWLGRKITGRAPAGKADAEVKSIEAYHRIATSDKPAKSNAVLFTIVAPMLALWVGWEIYSGAAIERNGGSIYRQIQPGWYWLDILFHGSVAAVVAWLAYRAWRSR